MSSASGAIHFIPIHAKAGVTLGHNVLLCDRSVEAGPSCAGFKLRVRAKQVEAATHALVGPFFMLVQVFAGEWSFRSFLPGDVILLWRELSPPLLVRLDDAHR